MPIPELQRGSAKQAAILAVKRFGESFLTLTDGVSSLSKEKSFFFMLIEIYQYDLIPLKKGRTDPISGLVASGC